jgi:photosystem II stability/assembly factor-like uncharacterized protein
MTLLFLQRSTTLSQWNSTTGIYGGGINAVAANGPYLFAATSDGVFRSIDRGAKWRPVNVGIANKGVHTLFVHDGTLFAGTDNSGEIFRSRDNGDDWSLVYSIGSGAWISALTTINTDILAATAAGIFRSTDGGENWIGASTDLPFLIYTSMADILTVDGTIFVGAGYYGVYRSTNDGVSWGPVNTGIAGAKVWSLASIGNNLLAGTEGGVFLTTDNGQSWTGVNTGLTNKTVHVLGSSNSRLFACTDDGIFVSSDYGSSWFVSNTGLTSFDIYAFAAIDTGVIVGTLGGDFFRSSNYGVSWSAPYSGLNKSIQSFASTGTTLFAEAGSLVPGSARTYCSKDDGINWIALNNAPANVAALASIDSSLFAGTYGGHFRSTDNGSTWVSTNDGIPNPYVESLARDGQTLIAGVFPNHIYASTDKGSSWNRYKRDLFGVNVTALAANDNGLFAACDGGLYFSARSDSNWQTIPVSPFRLVGSLVISGPKLFAGTDSGVFLSTNGGLGWCCVNSGLNVKVAALAVHNGSLFVGTHEGGIWRRSLSELISSTREGQPTQLSVDYNLGQNYPNPFNPSTKIRFSIPARSRVRLTIFNLLGQQVAELANEEMGAGNFERVWNANVASGLYFYRLEAVSVSNPSKRFVDVKKMVLVR